MFLSFCVCLAGVFPCAEGLISAGNVATNNNNNNGNSNSNNSNSQQYSTAPLYGRLVGEEHLAASLTAHHGLLSTNLENCSESKLPSIHHQYRDRSLNIYK